VESISAEHVFSRIDRVLLAIAHSRKGPPIGHTALRVRAAQSGRSTEAEVRAILAQSVKDDARLKIGT